jgi:hypothetical protein
MENVPQAHEITPWPWQTLFNDSGMVSACHQYLPEWRGLDGVPTHIFLP